MRDAAADHSARMLQIQIRNVPLVVVVSVLLVSLAVRDGVTYLFELLWETFSGKWGSNRRLGSLQRTAARRNGSTHGTYLFSTTWHTVWNQMALNGTRFRPFMCWSMCGFFVIQIDLVSDCNNVWHWIV